MNNIHIVTIDGETYPALVDWLGNITIIQDGFLTTSIFPGVTAKWGTWIDMEPKDFVSVIAFGSDPDSLTPEQRTTAAVNRLKLLIIAQQMQEALK